MSPDPIDPTVLDSLRALQEPGQPDVLTELIDLFLADAPPRITMVQGALAAGDGEALRRAAHALKGSAANVGAMGLAALCADLEQRGRHRAFDDADVVGHQLAQEYHRVETALRAARAPS